MAELDADIAGQKLKFNGPVNTLFTVLTFIGVSLVAYVTWNHAADAKSQASELSIALRDQTQALRENNCLQGYRGPDDSKAAFCKQVTR